MDAQRIRVLVVDDHPMIRAGLRAMIVAEAGFEWVGEAPDGAEAVRLCEALDPDVVLMDMMLPHMDGIDAASLVCRRRPATKVVILSSLVDPKQVRRAIAAGACGFVAKTVSAQELVTIIRSAHAGRRLMSADVTDAVIKAEQERPPGGDLTARERQVLALLASGRSNHDIAVQLAVTIPTVKFHITNILAKLHADNRTEAVLTALKHKLVVIE